MYTTNKVCSEYVDEISNFQKRNENELNPCVERRALQIPQLQFYHTLVVSLDHFLQKEKKIDVEERDISLNGYGVSIDVYNEQSFGLQLFEMNKHKEEETAVESSWNYFMTSMDYIYNIPVLSTSENCISNILYTEKETLLMKCFKIQLRRRYVKLSRTNKFIQLIIYKRYSVFLGKRQNKRFKKASVFRKFSKCFHFQTYFTEIAPNNDLLQMKTFPTKQENISECKKYLFRSKTNQTRWTYSLKAYQKRENKLPERTCKQKKYQRNQSQQKKWITCVYTMMLEKLETTYDEKSLIESKKEVIPISLHRNEESKEIERREKIQNKQLRIIVDDQLKFEVFYSKQKVSKTEPLYHFSPIVYFLHPLETRSLMESSELYVKNHNRMTEDHSMLFTNKNLYTLENKEEEEEEEEEEELAHHIQDHLPSYESYKNDYEVISRTCLENRLYSMSRVHNYTTFEKNKRKPHVFYDNVCLISPLTKEHINNNYYNMRSNDIKENRQPKCETIDHRTYSNTYSNTCSKNSSNTKSNTCSSNTYSKLSSNTYTSTCEHNYEGAYYSRTLSNTLDNLSLWHPTSKRRISMISKREDESEDTSVKPTEVVTVEEKNPSVLKISENYFKEHPREEVYSRKKRNSLTCKSIISLDKKNKKRKVSESQKNQERCIINDSEENRNEEEEWINNQTPIGKTKKGNSTNYDPYEEYLSYTSVSKSIPKRKENTASIEKKGSLLVHESCSMMMESQFHNELYERLLEVEMSESKESYMNNRLRDKLLASEDNVEMVHQGKRKGSSTDMMIGESEFVDDEGRSGKKRRKQTAEMEYEDELRENSINALLSNSVDNLLEDSDDFQSLQNLNRYGSTGTEGEVAVMERHSSILVNRGIRTKKYVDYSLYNTYAKSSFLQCAEQADNHYIGNYLNRFKDANFFHIRQKVKLNISRTFTNLQTTSETCVLHFTNLIFDLYISRFNSKEEIVDSIMVDLASEEKQFSEVMIQLLKEYYPKLYQEHLYKEQLKRKFTKLLHDLRESYDLIYHFIAVVCLFISQKYYNYRLISVDMIAKTYCKSHLEGLRNVRKSGGKKGSEEKATDYYSVAAYLDTTFTHCSVNKSFALEIEVCILKKLNYDLAIPTTYSLLDSLLKANENISFLKTRNNYNTAEGEILLRIASIDNVFLKYKTSTVAMAIYEILNFNIRKDQMQKEMFDVNSLYSRNSLMMRNPEQAIIGEEDMRTGKDLTLLKRQARSLIIAEEEDRFLTASKYLKNKSRLNHLMKKILMRICESTNKKFPQFYEAYEHQMAQKLNKYVKRFQKSKIKYMQKLQKRKFRKEQLKKELAGRETKGKEEPVSTIQVKQEPIEPPIKEKEMKTEPPKKKKKNNSKKNQKIKKKKNEKIHIKECLEENIEEPIESNRSSSEIMTMMTNTTVNESNNPNHSVESERSNKDSKFLHMKKKLLKNMRKYVKKIKKLTYTEIPHKYCSTYFLQGHDIKVYIKKESEDSKKKNSSNSQSKDATQGNGTQKEKHTYVIGSKTKSTDAHLVDYYNYVSKLRIQLIKGLNYFIKRIKRIQNVEVQVRRTDSEFFIKKKKKSNKKKKKQSKIVKKNIPLVKQLQNEIKLFYIWIYKLSNIEIRPLIKFGDLRFMSLVKLYRRNYSKYIENMITKLIKPKRNVGKNQSGGSQKKKSSGKAEGSKEGKTVTAVTFATSVTNNDKTLIDEFTQQMKNEKMRKRYIEELLKPVQEEATTFDEFVKSDALREKRGIRILMKDQNISGAYEQVMDGNNVKGTREDIENVNEEIEGGEEEENEPSTVSGLEELNITLSQKKRSDQSINQISFCEHSPGQRMDMLQSNRSNRNSVGMPPCYNMQNELIKESIFGNTTMAKKSKEESDWITINDPQVDECAKELMEAFLKWKHKNFISKNWTFHEYPDSRDFYYSLIFGDLKSSESLKYINEMMNMKYIHLLKIYKDDGIMVNVLDDL